MDRPKTEVRVDVRFRLHRFATHLQEHTIQIEKALDDLGCDRATLRASSAGSRSPARCMSASPTPGVLAALDAEHQRKATELGV